MVLSRRHLALAALAAPAIIAGRPSRAASVVLRAGDQKGGCASLLRGAGLLDDLPYAIEWSQFAAAAPLLEALNADAVDVAAAGDAPITFALAAGVRARLIAAIKSDGGATAILVGKNSPITSVAGLRGAKVAANRGSIAHALLLAVARREGWAADELRLVNLMPADARAALASGAVDAWSTWNSYVARAEIEDGARIVVDGKGGLLTGLGFLAAGEAAVGSKRAALADFVGRLARARRWAIAHPDAYAEVLAAEIGVSVTVARRAWAIDLSAPVPIDDAVIGGEQRTADLYADAGLIPARLNAAAFFDHGFNDVAGVRA